MLSKTNTYVVAVLIDIQGAFDSLWWPEILNNLNRLQISKTFFEIILSYLSKRTVTLSNDGEVSTREKTKGCPQGLVLGPLIWNVTFGSLLNKDFPPGITPIAFADDVAFLISGDTRRQIEERGNQTMDILSDWASKTKISISSQKSKLVILKGNMNARPPVIKYREIRISKVESVAYLGIEIDTGLTFLPHIKKQGVKARTLFRKIGRLLKVTFGANTVNLNFLYKTVYIPIISYASKAWIHKIDHWSIVKNLKETQRQVLINTTGANRTSPLQALCVVSNNPPIHLKLKEIQELSNRVRGPNNETKAQITPRMLTNWQTEWDTVTIRRYTHKLLPSITERQTLKHLSDIDHGVIQLLTGHGPYKSYLKRFMRSDTDLCQDCGDLDDASHSIFECETQEDLRILKHEKVLKVGESPWNFLTLLRHKVTFKVLKSCHTKAVDKRKV